MDTPRKHQCPRCGLIIMNYTEAVHTRLCNPEEARRMLAEIAARRKASQHEEVRLLDDEALACLREATGWDERDGATLRAAQRTEVIGLLMRALTMATMPVMAWREKRAESVRRHLRDAENRARKGLGLTGKHPWLTAALLLLPSLAHASPGGTSDWDGGYLVAGLAAVGIIALIWLMEEVD